MTKFLLSKNSHLYGKRQIKKKCNMPGSNRCNKEKIRQGDRIPEMEALWAEAGIMRR